MTSQTQTDEVQMIQMMITQDDIMDAQNDVTVTTSSGSNSWAIPEAFEDF